MLGDIGVFFCFVSFSFFSSPIFKEVSVMSLADCVDNRIEISVVAHDREHNLGKKLLNIDDCSP